MGTTTWGRWRVRLTVPGMAVAAGVALLAPPAVEARDRLGVGILTAAIFLLVVNALWARLTAARRIDIVAPEVVWSWSPGAIEVTVESDTKSVYDVSLLSTGGIASTAARAGDRTALQYSGLPTGRYHHVIVEVMGSAPFGLAAVGRRAVVELDRAINVVPPPADVDPVILRHLTDTAAEYETDEVAGLRERRSGDRLRDVDWPAVARTGRLIVRQRDLRAFDMVAVAVESPDESRRSLNQALHFAHGLTRHLLAQGHSVELTLRQSSAAGHRRTPDPDRDILGIGSADGANTTTRVVAPTQIAAVLSTAVPGPVEVPDTASLVCRPDGVVPV